MNKGRFIVFEGIDGAGKTTQIRLLEQALSQRGRRVFCTAEPTESVSGGMLRDALSGVRSRTPCELTALFTLDRIFHNVNPVSGIEKMLSEGYDVICDRYYYSTLAYQGSETDAEWVKSMNLRCPEIRRPDLCIFLDLTPEESMARIEKNRATTEIYETRERLETVRNRFLCVLEELKNEERICIVSAAGSIEQVHADVLRAIGE